MCQRSRGLEHWLAAGFSNRFVAINPAQNQINIMCMPTVAAATGYIIIHSILVTSIPGFNDCTIKPPSFSHLWSYGHSFLGLQTLQFFANA